MRRHGPPSADPIKVRISIIDKGASRDFLLKSPPNTYDGEGIGAGVVGGDSQFQAIKARLIKYPIIELYVNVWILAKARISVVLVIFWLWGRIVNILGLLPP